MFLFTILNDICIIYTNNCVTLIITNYVHNLHLKYIYIKCEYLTTTHFVSIQIENIKLGFCVTD